MVNDPKCYGKYLEERGWVQCPRIKRGRKYLTGKEFCAITNMPRFILAHIGAHHMVCIVDNSIVDYWDCTDQRVGIYWIKQDQGLSGTMEYGA
jgi:hypothetical protein